MTNLEIQQEAEKIAADIETAVDNLGRAPSWIDEVVVDLVTRAVKAERVEELEAAILKTADWSTQRCRECEDWRVAVEKVWECFGPTTEGADMVKRMEIARDARVHHCDFSRPQLEQLRAIERLHVCPQCSAACLCKTAQGDRNSTCEHCVTQPEQPAAGEVARRAAAVVFSQMDSLCGSGPSAKEAIASIIESELSQKEGK